jgi:hypothetical protein
MSGVFDLFPAELENRPRDMRRALARVGIAQFFQAANRGASYEARKHLEAGLPFDPLWLANRGVMALFGLKGPLARRSS